MQRLFVLLLGVGLLTGCGSNQGAMLQASGLVEATEILIAPEIGGRVAEVLVSKGDSVSEGEPLLRIEDQLLNAQRQAVAASVVTAKAALESAEAAYASAQTQYEITLAAAREQDRFARIEDWVNQSPDPFDQPGWYFTHDEEMGAAQSVILTAEENLKKASANLDQVISELEDAEFPKAEKRLADARITYLVTRDLYERAKLSNGDVNPSELEYPDIPQDFQGTYADRIAIAKRLSGDPDLVHAAQRIYDAAKIELQAAQSEYDRLLTSESAMRVLDARAEVQIAQEQVEIAHEYSMSLNTGENSLYVAVARETLEQARVGREQAEAAVMEAEARLLLLDLQIDRLTVAAPVGGVVLTRSIQPGEIVQAGTPVMTIAQLDSLTVVVYISEDRYGNVHLGGSADLSVDSFPGETFQAVVTRIADRAEFTPRNVQTREERQTTVYAVELTVENLEGKLKPGMPVDVDFHLE